MPWPVRILQIGLEVGFRLLVGDAVLEELRLMAEWQEINSPTSSATIL
jgi:hypothetical protein